MHHRQQSDPDLQSVHGCSERKSWRLVPRARLAAHRVAHARLPDLQRHPAYGVGIRHPRQRIAVADHGRFARTGERMRPDRGVRRGIVELEGHRLTDVATRFRDDVTRRADHRSRPSCRSRVLCGEKGPTPGRRRTPASTAARPPASIRRSVAAALHRLEGSHRVEGSPPAPEAIRAARKVLLEDRFRDLADGVLAEHARTPSPIASADAHAPRAAARPTPVRRPVRRARAPGRPPRARVAQTARSSRINRSGFDGLGCARRGGSIPSRVRTAQSGSPSSDSNGCRLIQSARAPRRMA